jgi:hypothetical protein
VPPTASHVQGPARGHSMAPGEGYATSLGRRVTVVAGLESHPSSLALDLEGTQPHLPSSGNRAGNWRCQLLGHLQRARLRRLFPSH